MTTDKDIERACKAAKKIKKAKQVGSYAWVVKGFHVQTNAELYDDDEMQFTFATCDCGADYDEGTTVCAHVIRVLMEIRRQYE